MNSWWSELMQAIDNQYMGELLASVAQHEETMKRRNAERDFARNTGYSGEAYWLTMTLQELRAAQS